MSGKPEPSFAPCYAALYPLLAETARAYGYALAIHGSMTRDFDLIAAPWVEDAAAPEAMIEALCLATGGSMAARWVGAQPQYSDVQPTKKSHGRLAWSIYLGKAYIDISVMPMLREPPPKEPT